MKLSLGKGAKYWLQSPQNIRPHDRQWCFLRPSQNSIWQAWHREIAWSGTHRTGNAGLRSSIASHEQFEFSELQSITGCCWRITLIKVRGNEICLTISSDWLLATFLSLVLPLHWHELFFSRANLMKWSSRWSASSFSCERKKANEKHN